jgi:hypothetical protein
LDLYYSDTDSLVLNGALPAEVCDSARLGQLKLEHTFIEGIFVMPKVYYLETSEGDIITRCKGYPDPGKLTRNQYLELLEGNSLELDVIRWNRSLRASKIQLKEVYLIDLLLHLIKELKSMTQMVDGLTQLR